MWLKILVDVHLVHAVLYLHIHAVLSQLYHARYSHSICTQVRASIYPMSVYPMSIYRMHHIPQCKNETGQRHQFPVNGSVNIKCRVGEDVTWPYTLDGKHTLYRVSHMANGGPSSSDRGHCHWQLNCAALYPHCSHPRGVGPIYLCNCCWFVLKQRLVRTHWN